MGPGAHIPQNTYCPTLRNCIGVKQFLAVLLGRTRDNAYLTGTDLVKLSRHNSSKLCQKSSGQSGKGLAPLPQMFTRFLCAQSTRKCFERFWSFNKVITTMVTRPLDDPLMMCSSICGPKLSTASPETSNPHSVHAECVCCQADDAIF